MKFLSYIGLLLFIFFSTNLSAQNKYFVFLKDKKGAEFEPFEYFDAKSIERRIKNGITLNDLTDYPVSKEYTNEISEFCEGIGFQSRWLNMVVVHAFPYQIKIIRNFNYVVKVEEPQILITQISSIKNDSTLTKKELLLKSQLSSMGGDLFETDEIRGKGVRIAVFDIGFQHVNTHGAFKHIRDSGRLLKTWDFVDNEENVYESGTHGRSVLSCIGGIYDGDKIGLATEAEYILARTEYAKSEPFVEEEFWLAAAEWADKNGADIINSSLGYTKSRYFPNDMNGQKSLVARAANMAARKGILVVNSMGNEGNNDWKVLATPADADSVLSVGAISFKTGYITSFSSYGPTSDHRRKPNVSAFGYVIAASAAGLINTAGTSLSSPLVAGFAACVLQLNPAMTNMELFKAIEESGNLYPYYDYLHGYGIPQAAYFLTKEEKNDSALEIIVEENSIIVNVDTTLITEDGFNLLYYHIENDNGVLEKYSVIDVYQKEVISFEKDRFRNGQKLRVHFSGITKEFRK